jgi:excisionase family DNA binding protein
MAALEIPSLVEIEALLRRVVREELAGRDADMVSPEEAAKRTGLSVATIRRAYKSGSLPSKRIGKRKVGIPVAALRPSGQAEVVELAFAARHRRR